VLLCGQAHRLVVDGDEIDGQLTSPGGDRNSRQRHDRKDSSDALLFQRGPTIVGRRGVCGRTSDSFAAVTRRIRTFPLLSPNGEVRPKAVARAAPLREEAGGSVERPHSNTLWATFDNTRDRLTPEAHLPSSFGPWEDRTPV
jgi:hypothetical protein